MIPGAIAAIAATLSQISARGVEPLNWPAQSLFGLAAADRDVAGVRQPGKVVEERVQRRLLSLLDIAAFFNPRRYKLEGDRGHLSRCHGVRFGDRAPITPGRDLTTSFSGSLAASIAKTRDYSPPKPSGTRFSCGPKNTSARSSILSRGGALGGLVGSSNAV